MATYVVELTFNDQLHPHYVIATMKAPTQRVSQQFKVYLNGKAVTNIRDITETSLDEIQLDNWERS